VRNNQKQKTGLLLTKNVQKQRKSVKNKFTFEKKKNKNNKKSPKTGLLLTRPKKTKFKNKSTFERDPYRALYWACII